MEKWAELRTAYQVAKLGTVTAAAKALGFHRATVNRHIDALEEELGSRVFIRHARGYELTELGKEALRTAQATERLLDDLVGLAAVEKNQVVGDIKLTTIAFCSPLIMQPIMGFRRDNPHCKVHICVSQSLARLDHGEAHIALRAGPKPTHPDYIVQTFAKVHFNLYAHDCYIQQYGLPTGVDDLVNHQFIVPPLDSAPAFFREWVNTYVDAQQVAAYVDNMSVGYDALAAGLGIGFLNHHDVAKRTDLHPILPPNKAWSVTIWLVTHVDLHRTAKVQAMLKCLKTSIKKP
jgi:DNA-binding transcriptional LysR family regulator